MGGNDMAILTIAQCIHVYEHGQLQARNFTPDVVTAAYAAGLAALREKAERENPAPLTPAEIREMRGQPVWCPEVESYGIITMDKIGAFANKPFLQFFWLENEDANCGVDCEYNIEERGLTLYRYKPPEKGGGNHAKD